MTMKALRSTLWPSPPHLVFAKNVHNLQTTFHSDHSEAGKVGIILTTPGLNPSCYNNEYLLSRTIHFRYSDYVRFKLNVKWNSAKESYYKLSTYTHTINDSSTRVFNLFPISVASKQDSVFFVLHDYSSDKHPLAWSGLRLVRHRNSSLSPQIRIKYHRTLTRYNGWL